MVNFVKYCCEMPLNPFDDYCPRCGRPTDTKRQKDQDWLDEIIARMKKRHGTL